MQIVEHYRNPVNAALLRGGAASAGETESDCLRNRRIEAAQLIAVTGDGDGDGDPMVERVLDHVVAPIIYRVIFRPQTLDEHTAERLVGELFAR